MLNSIRCIVVGLGVQGRKRRAFAKDDFVASVDPFNENADFRSVSDVPLSSYDAVLACIPDAPKTELLSYCIENGKHVLVEKPLWALKGQQLHKLQQEAMNKGVVIYTAYNHRFEPHFMRMRNLIDSGELGKIYSCRMFYGNGTARLVRNSQWRDHGAGVLPDLGSHLLDTSRFWFDNISERFTLTSASSFENQSPDHVVISNHTNKPRLELEMTLLMWRNHFTCDILAEKGTAHISSLCKWGPSTFTHRKRILPSGRPPENAIMSVQEDPTWEAEYEHFKSLIKRGASTDLSGDIWIHDVLSRLGENAIARAREYSYGR